MIWQLLYCQVILYTVLISSPPFRQAYSIIVIASLVSGFSTISECLPGDFSKHLTPNCTDVLSDGKKYLERTFYIVP